ncbi:MAG: BadF/BadG/BcrA/BcrD ATPase family protein [FCB group bacterium]|jgi:activator of 2-hydroxyglutaryl-CoA dehydratase/predicted nucleotide-binding protein (sugar kinase/HSP70/actin superfamily)|nr:BadF/BadG/BcrA/BcrD ATPase family protein [FCB group bacterium]
MFSHTAKFSGTSTHPQGLLVGLDVGSTTVKAVVVDPATEEVVWRDYRRHETRQPEICLDFLNRISASFPGVPKSAFRIFATGSGGASMAELIGARFVQEVNAVSLAVERLHPEVESVVELGGQDAKIIVFKTDPTSGRRQKIATMNDKCAGGTGAVIDKIAAKLKIPAERISEMRYDGVTIHPVAGKCGVFAETDINGLQKQGVPAEELIASLFDALVLQNLSVLTRGNTLRPTVLLLGGPNAFVKGLQECWRKHIPGLWAERDVPLPEGRGVKDLVVVPENAHYYGALGAAEFGRIDIQDNPNQGVYAGPEALRRHVAGEHRPGGIPGLVRNAAEREAFERAVARPPWNPPKFTAGEEVDVYIGLDGGSTSTKAVLIDEDCRVLAKAYRLSQGNPIEDTIDLFADLRRQIESQGARIRVLGVGTTGYAKDMLKDVLKADVALVETVAHTQSGLHYYPHADVICDVGGQDIKLIFLKAGAVKDFRLNTQCSAGNGYFLQATACEFGYAVEEYAEKAFTADAMPEFGYGCAVFMQSDIVDFQRQGWRPNEILAGLAAVLPKNIWLYVAQAPNLAQLGRTFILQGGTQRNLAAVKAQMDFIRSRFAGTGVEPELVVHEHCGESGAIGCAFEARRLRREEGRETSFIGLDAVASIRYHTTRDETTRCNFCKNGCLRTFIDVSTDEEQRTLIVASCEKGAVERLEDMREIKRKVDAAKKANPNLSEWAAREAFKPVSVEPVTNGRRRWPWRKVSIDRTTLRIGMPRVMNLYAHAPFFTGYFQSLGVPSDNIVWSDVTSDSLYRDGARRGSIDPCFPSKLGIPHIHNLLHAKHTVRKPLTHIFFPMVDAFPTWLVGAQGSRACPAGVGTIEATHAAFVKETDVFLERGIVFKKTFLNLDRPGLCGRQMYEDWKADLGISEEESRRAVEQGLHALAAYEAEQRRRGRAVLDELEREGRLGIVLLARPYHNDPGVNHGIPEEFQERGYPVLTLDSLPMDDDFLDALFGEEVRAGEVSHALSIDDVWKNAFSEHSSRKIWGAKCVARHPNLVALELSSFKCGHDSPVYAAIEEIIESAGLPHFSFKDIDENRPRGSIKIRVETIVHFLKRYQETLPGAAIVNDEV